MVRNLAVPGKDGTGHTKQFINMEAPTTKLMS